MKAFLLEPYPTAMIYVGGTGIGKTSTAMAMSNALVDEGWFGRSEYCEIGANFKTEKAEYYFGPDTPFRYSVSPGKYHILRIEELERLPQNVQGMLKEAIEDFCRRYRLIVLATSNDTSRLETALLHRFKVFGFDSGQGFYEAFRDWLAVVWPMECGDPLPAESGLWGLVGDGTFSARLAFDEAQSYLMSRRGEVAQEEKARVTA